MTAKNTSSGLISYIYKSRKNILELMKKQEYNIDDYDNFSINEVNSMSQNKQLDILVEKNDENGSKKKIYIRYYLEKSIKKLLLLAQVLRVWAALITLCAVALMSWFLINIPRLVGC